MTAPRRCASSSRSTARKARPCYGIKEHADDHTIFVAGQANGTWADSDVDYVKALVAKFEGDLCLDQSRILATGFSMGGAASTASSRADRPVAPPPDELLEPPSFLQG